MTISASESQRFTRPAASRRFPNVLSKRFLCLLVLFATLPACGRAIEVPLGLEGPGDFAHSTPAGAGIPCNLLTLEEIATALNSPAPNAVPFGRPVLVGMDMCRSGQSAVGGTTQPQRNPPEASVGWGVVSESARRQFNRYKSVNSRYVEELEIRGRPAIWDAQLATMIALKGKHAIAVRIAVARPDLPENLSRQDYLRETARLLAARAMRRMP